ncbi:uncharacterized protein LOC135389578 [Ornithodoros turicata]|uniref:uncharacterized protein LOC135389578 n=1 Tax=Ornithodoros turicata TaxID=34597 RepID=UPI0031390106
MEVSPTAANVGDFAIYLPPFIRSRPDLWFPQAESQFSLGGITTQSIRYHHISSVVCEDVLLEASDVLSSPPLEDPYDALKRAIISIVHPSDRQRLHELFSKEPLGDRKPSQLVRHMKQILGTAPFDDKLFRELLLSKLPHAVQLALSVPEETCIAAVATR